MKNAYILLFLIFSLTGITQEKNDHQSDNRQLDMVFESKPTQIVYKNEQEMISHLKNSKSQTFKYYSKLNSTSKDKVYQNHIRNPKQNITHIILELYLERS